MQHRRQQLIHAYQRVLNSCTKGAPVTKRNYARVMRQITHDLNTLQQLPSRWETLSRTQLDALIAHWRAQAQSMATIANKLSILRGFFKRAYQTNPLPSNAALGLTWISPMGNPSEPEGALSKVAPSLD